MSSDPREQYQALAAEFSYHKRREVGGGLVLDYLTGEQVTSRLNDVLGYDRWTFEVTEHGFNAEADELWVLGKLLVYSGDGRVVSRQQFGSNKIKRARSTGTPLDLGFDLKAAATDALKKCASLIGVGLYLYSKEEDAAQPANGGSARAKPAPASHGSPACPTNPQGHPLCADCGKPLEPVTFRDNTTWDVTRLADFGVKKHGRWLDMPCYRKANDARNRAAPEEAL